MTTTNETSLQSQYEIALADYKEKRVEFYTDLLENKKTFNKESPKYIAYMKSNETLERLGKEIISLHDSNSEHSSLYSTPDSQSQTHFQLMRHIHLLRHERDTSDEMLNRYGTISGNLVVSQQYAESERMKQSIWLTICILIAVFAVKSFLFPQSFVDVFNTTVFGLIIFLIVYVTENMGGYNMFAIWLLLMSSLGVYIFKHMADRKSS
jgi:hypothetical protein